MRKIFAALAALCFSVGNADAAVTWDFRETAAGVVGTLSGSLDLTGALSTNLAVVSNGVVPKRAFISTGGTVATYQTTSGPTAFGTGDGRFVSRTFTGSLFFLLGDSAQVGVAPDYVSGTALTGTVFIFEQTSSSSVPTFASLGIARGSYQWTLPNDTITVNFGTTPIPLPASLPLLLGALGLAGVVARRRKT